MFLAEAVTIVRLPQITAPRKKSNEYAGVISERAERTGVDRKNDPSGKHVKEEILGDHADRLWEGEVAGGKGKGWHQGAELVEGPRTTRDTHIANGKASVYCVEIMALEPQGLCTRASSSETKRQETGQVYECRTPL